jgi:Protein of unknown function (DUF2949)
MLYTSLHNYLHLTKQDSIAMESHDTGQATTQAKLIQFLKEELAVPAAAIALALRNLNEQGSNLLPVVLWQYGLITLEQLERAFDWMETA